MERSNKKMMIVFCVVMASLAATSVGTMQDDENECAEQLTNLAACIPFVSGTAQKPTPQCCEDTQKVKSTKPKCLCVLIKESTDPSMGLPVNTTLALQMPSVCNIDAKISDCPTILNLPADSPDAKIFKEAGSDSPPNSGSSSSGSSPTPSGSGSSSSDSKASPSSSSSTSGGPKLKYFERGSLLAMLGLIAWIFI